MKQFFKFLLASITGVIIGGFLLFFIVIGIVSAMIASAGNEEVDVADNSVLQIKLEQPITDRAPKSPFSDLEFGSFSKKMLGLDQILESLDKAGRDKRIKVIFLDLTDANAGIATLEEIRNKLLELKKSGKKIISYGEYYSQPTYYLATVSDRLYLNPQGAIDFKGIKAELLFFKNALEKLELEPQIIRHGKFKAAVEPFMLDAMSEENRIQTRTYISGIWNHMLSGIATQRKLTAERLQLLADSLLIQEAEDAVREKLADRLAYRDEVLEELRKITKAPTVDELKLVKLEKYGNAVLEEEDDNFSTNKIAVVYAIGEIQSGEGDDETIGSDRISKAIREARLDKKVKAIVLRVNSPGGSALASEVIWREASLAKKSKPVIVSMGNLAASGGYYISCSADTIVAQPNTITGSIGVFGMLLNAQKFMNNKIGINVDTVKTAEYADIGSVFRPLKPHERNVIQKSVEKVYDVFITRVAEGRKLTKEQVDAVGQGRVWSGVDAKNIGLVDVLGGLDTAIEIAARKAGVSKDYRLISLPKQKDPLTALLTGAEEEVKARFIQNELGDAYRYMKHLRSALKYHGIQARIPYEVTIY